ncbi:MAG TPA: ABC transporter substrate-binding protein, partial [Chitinophagaceae bacterium]|nr:ABC transporter substrate-binding protein [Chitinophagaceae bacterium]
MFNYRNIFVIVCMLMSFVSIAQHPQLTWSEVAPGVWRGVAGKPEDYDLLKASGSIPNKDALAKMSAAGFPLSQNDISGMINDAKTCLRFPLEKEEQLYGFGLNFQTVHQRGKILQLHMDHYGGKDNGRTHAPVP